MKNTRKKLLVSSAAMLLVSAMAVSTATFAWFTSSTVATANGINVRTSKASKLEISKNDLQWGTLIDYDVDNKLLLPVSSGNGTAWFKAEAAAADASTLKTGTIESVTDLGAYVIKNQLNVHNAGEATVKNVKIEFSVPNDYLRVALVEANKGGADATNSGTFATSIYDTEKEKYTGLTATDGTGVEITGKTECTINVGALAKDAVKYYNLYVWFEGQDADCKDSNAGKVVNDIEFTVTGDTVVS